MILEFVTGAVHVQCMKCSSINKVPIVILLLYNVYNIVLYGIEIREKVMSKMQGNAVNSNKSQKSKVWSMFIHQ